MACRLVVVLLIAVSARSFTADLQNANGGDNNANIGEENDGDSRHVFKTRADGGRARPTKRPCTNTHGDDDCETWAKQGECEKNPASMLSLCPQACGTCQELENFKKHNPRLTFRRCLFRIYPDFHNNQKTKALDYQKEVRNHKSEDSSKRRRRKI